MIAARDIAALVRALDDELLVALVAPILRERLGLSRRRRTLPEPVRAPEHPLGDLGPLDDSPRVETIGGEHAERARRAANEARAAIASLCDPVGLDGADGAVQARREAIESTTMPRSLPMFPLPVDKITSGDHPFACEPLHATLLARSCVHRQKVASKEHRDGLRAGQLVALGRRENYGTCRDCALGRAVAARLGGGS